MNEKQVFAFLGGRFAPIRRTYSLGLKLGDGGYNHLRGKNVVLDKKEALNFFGFFKGDINHECYEEGCTFNEVVEHYGYSEKSVRFQTVGRNRSGVGKKGVLITSLSPHHAP